MSKAPTTHKSPAELIRGNRGENESRAAQARRLGFSEATLRQYERDNRLPPNPFVRRALLRALAVKP